MNVSNNIKNIRKEKGLTQTEVAKRYGTSPEFYHRLEKKDKSLTIDQLEKIAVALEVPVTEILDSPNNGSDFKILQDKVTLLEKENIDLKGKLAIYQPMFKMVEFLMANPALVENFSKKATEDKVSKVDVENSFPVLKEILDSSTNPATSNK